MYVRLDYLIFAIFALIAAVALILLIIVLFKLNKVLTVVGGILQRNEKNIDKVMETLPQATNNFLELSDDLRLVGEVITETTASAIETKEHIEDYVSIFKEILLIVKHVFGK